MTDNYYKAGQLVNGMSLSTISEISSQLKYVSKNGLDVNGIDVAVNDLNNSLISDVVISNPTGVGGEYTDEALDVNGINTVRRAKISAGGVGSMLFTKEIKKV